MALVEINQVSFAYPEQDQNTLYNIDLQIKEGSFVVIAGPSGCGKTTLLRLLKKEIQPVGKLEGEIRFQGKKLAELSTKDSTESIAWVAQDPENQAVMDEVRQELAFSLENLNLPPAVMRKRVAEVSNFFGIEHWMDKLIHQLSGGQKQKLHLASALLLHPKLLLLDEPTAQLDPISAKELIQTLYQLNQEFGLTVVLVEHRLDELFSLADWVVLLEQGRMSYSGTPHDIVAAIRDGKDDGYLAYLPAITQLACQLGGNSIPLTVKEGRDWFRSMVGQMESNQSQKETPTTRDVLMEMDHLFFQYSKKEEFILKGLQLKVYAGDFLAIFGGNGSGKSTLLHLMSGLSQPKKGQLRFQGKKLKSYPTQELYRKIGYLSQNPMLHFLYDTVQKELDHTLKQFLGLTDHQSELIARLGIGHLLDRHPYDCSGGEKQKVALATVLLRQPQMLILDEPTKGLDPAAKQEFGLILQELHREGVTIVLVTHDIEFAAQYATRCAMLFEGAIASEGDPKAFFQENYFYTTSINRVVREWLPTVLTKEEVLNQCKQSKSLPSPS